MKFKPNPSTLTIILALAATIPCIQTGLAQEKSKPSASDLGAISSSQQAESGKPIEPSALGEMYYLNPTTHTITPLPKETWTAVGKSKPAGFAAVSAIGSLQFSGLSSTFRVPAGEKSEFLFTAADPSSVKLYLCVQNEKKKFRKIDVVATKRTGVFVVTASQKLIDGVAVEVEKYGEASYKLVAPNLAPGEYAILNGGNAFTFGIQ